MNLFIPTNPAELATTLEQGLRNERIQVANAELITRLERVVETTHLGGQWSVFSRDWVVHETMKETLPGGIELIQDDGRVLVGEFSGYGLLENQAEDLGRIICMTFADGIFLLDSEPHPLSSEKCVFVPVLSVIGMSRPLN